MNPNAFLIADTVRQSDSRLEQDALAPCVGFFNGACFAIVILSALMLGANALVWVALW